MEKYDDGKLHGQVITCQPEGCGKPQAKWGISHVKAFERGEF